MGVCIMAITKQVIGCAALLIPSVAGLESDLKGGVIKLDWSDCGDSATHGHITSLTPSTLTIGDKTSVAGKGSIDEDIQGASYKVTAKALGITVFSHQGDACKPETITLPAGAGTIDLTGFTCPLSKGDVELDLDINLASTIPKTCKNDNRAYRYCRVWRQGLVRTDQNITSLRRRSDCVKDAAPHKIS